MNLGKNTESKNLKIKNLEWFRCWFGCRGWCWSDCRGASWSGVMEVLQTSPSGWKVLWITKFFCTFILKFFLHTLSSWFEGSDPPPLSWACIAVFATAIFQVRKIQGISNSKFQGISNSKFQGISNSKKLITDFFLRRRAAVQGSVKKKRTEWKTSMFAKSKFLLKVDPHTTYYMISNTQTKTCESVLINDL